MIERVVRLGFEVRVELVRRDGDHLWAQLSRDEAEQLEVERGLIVYVKRRESASSQLRRPVDKALSHKVGSSAPTDSHAGARRRGASPLGEVARDEVGEGRRLQHRRSAARTAIQTVCGTRRAAY